MTVPLSTEASFLPATYSFPKENNDFLRELNILYRRIAASIAEREIARYDCIDQGSPIVPPGFERVTGQQWFGPNNQVKRPGFRKVVLFPALSAGATNTQPHNLGTITSYTFTRIDGVMQNPAGSQFSPVPQGSPNNAYVDISGANVRIILPGGSPWAGFTAIVVLEYLKN